MLISGDILLRHSLWNEAEEKLCDGFIFSRLVDLFIVACCIGIKDDEIIENDLTDDDRIKSIGRTTYLVKNEDVNAIFYFMFQNAILNTKHVNFDNDTRMRIAFDPDFPDEKTKINLSPTGLLVKFANYGLKQLFDLFNQNEQIYIENIKELLDSKITPDFSDIIGDIEKEMENL